MTNEQSPLRIAFVDLETRPLVGYTWKTWDTNIIALVKEWAILSFAVKWSDSKKVETYTLPDFDLYKTDPENDLELVKKLWEVFNSADLICAHNLDAFDGPKAFARFIYHNLPPPSPYKGIDTLRIARKHFSFTSNRLNDLATHLGIGKKVETGGFDLWLKCMNGDPKAWAKMRKYNRMDVILLEKVYERLRPWHTSHPNVAINEEDLACPSCGSKKVQRRGYTYLVQMRARRYVCTSCGRWSRGKNERIGTGERLR